MRRGGRLVLVLAAVAAFVIGLDAAFSGPVTAQDYPPSMSPEKMPRPTETPEQSKCIQTGRYSDRQFKPTMRFHPGEKVTAKGADGCSQSKRRVAVYFDMGTKDWVLLGTTTSSDRGLYTVVGNVPRKAAGGRHDLRIETVGRSYRTAIVTQPQGGPRQVSAVIGGAVAGWVALGSIFAAFAIARRRRGSIPRGAARIDVPTLDTSSFVPSYTRQHKTSAKKTSRRPAATTKKPEIASRKKPTRPATSGRGKPKTTAEAKRSTGGRSAHKPARKGRATTDRSGSTAPRRASGKTAPRRNPKKGGETPEPPRS